MYVKRIIAFMISLIMCIISAVPAALAQTEEINLSYIFNENFDRLNSGAYSASNARSEQNQIRLPLQMMETAAKILSLPLQQRQTFIWILPSEEFIKI